MNRMTTRLGSRTGLETARPGGTIPTMTIVDFHTHAFPDSLASRAITTLEAASGDWKAVLDGRVSSLLASMDAAGVTRSVVCPIATGPYQFPGILAWCLAIRSDRLVPLGSTHPKAPDPVDEVRQIAAAGLAGIKLHPMYQDFDIDEPRMDPIYAAAAEARLLMVLHCGSDIAYPGMDCATPQRVANVARRHPKLRLVATHLGGWRMWEGSRRHVVGLNMWLETSFSINELAPEESVALIRTHGADKVLFGTDSPWASQQTEVDRVRALPLAEAEKAGILGGNAEKLLAGLS